MASKIWAQLRDGRLRRQYGVMQDSAARVVVVFATAAYQFGGRFATGLGSVLFPLSVGARAVSGRPYADTPLIPPWRLEGLVPEAFGRLKGYPVTAFMSH